MILKNQKRLAAKIAGKSKKKISFDLSRIDEIKEAITRADIKGLIQDGAISVGKEKGISKSRSRKNRLQKLKGRKRGQGSRKGKKTARQPGKRAWINRIRLQRDFLKSLKVNKKIAGEVYKDLYRKAKGGFFRNKRHIKLYLTEHKLVK